MFFSWTVKPSFRFKRSSKLLILSSYSIPRAFLCILLILLLISLEENIHTKGAYAKWQWTKELKAIFFWLNVSKCWYLLIAINLELAFLISLLRYLEKFNLLNHYPQQVYLFVFPNFWFPNLYWDLVIFPTGYNKFAFVCIEFHIIIFKPIQCICWIIF